MIGRLEGTLLAKNPPQVLINVAGVGYEVDVPMSTFYDLPEIGKPVVMLTHMVVREDAQLLYGFLTATERHAFKELIKVSGVGPRIGLAVLSGLSVDQLVAAVAQQESGLLTRVPGIGKKTAERLILELKGRLADAVNITASAGRTTEAADVMHALLALGYSEKEALAASRGIGPELSLSEAIKQALKQLAK